VVVVHLSVSHWGSGNECLFVYNRTYEAEAAKKEVGLLRKWTLLEFVIELIANQ
jgi:hypothetical protein